MFYVGYAGSFCCLLLQPHKHCQDLLWYLRSSKLALKYFSPKLSVPSPYCFVTSGKSWGDARAGIFSVWCGSIPQLACGGGLLWVYLSWGEIVKVGISPPAGKGAVSPANTSIQSKGFLMLVLCVYPSCPWQTVTLWGQCRGEFRTGALHAV